MSERPTTSQPTQPREGEPVEIPVPTKRDVFDAFRKVAKARQPDEDVPGDNEPQPD